MFEGVTVALVTPFRGGEVDEGAIESLVEMHVDAGTHVVSPCGTTGESPTLDDAEHRAVVRRVLRAARGRIPVLAGTGSNDTRRAVALTRAAAEEGAAGALVVVPYYNRPTQEGLLAHFRRVAAASDLPIVLYNVPSRTGCTLEAETVLRLAETRNIVAIKEASGNLDAVTRLSAAGMTVLSGDDATTVPFMSVGAKGVVSVAANVAAREMREMVDACHRGNGAAALSLHRRLYPLFRALFLESNPIPVKAALEMLGRIDAEVRLPLTPLSESNRQKLREALSVAGIREPAAAR
ncbi:MAG: 4-hydroxy-tetrahydrodipicolinate synthase [Planctomycetes bacterium]|nr:4-hydroxy-tetrahydrodipicolinate synthase [Planctomycetota bacterium]MBI3846909.1 4-hydroxy-tetrahydrodipicolinate synthase [Planctomycetota bacterium]